MCSQTNDMNCKPKIILLVRNVNLHELGFKTKNMPNSDVVTTDNENVQVTDIHGIRSLL